MRYLVAVIVCMISVSVFGQTDILGCMDPLACNYNPDATIDDGSCDYCSCDIIASDAYSLTIESSAAVAADGTTYRFYVNMTDSTDRLSSVFGHNNSHLIINTPEGAFNSPNNSGWSAAGLNPAFLSTFPDMADDTYATIGLDGPASTSGIAGAADPSIVEDPAQPITPYFLTDGATSLSSTTLIGSSWYVLNTAGNGLPNNDMRVLVLQVTTTGSISGTINYQVFPLGVGAEQVQITTEFDGVGVFSSSHTEYGCGCTDASACNYAVEAIYDDGSCTYINITEGECDCAGNVLDECGVCNGPGAVYDCGCSDIPEDDCDCDGNVLDECGECNGDNESCSGCCITFAINYDPQALVCDITICEYQPTCADGDACNYDSSAVIDDGSFCVYPDECGVCDGDATGPSIPEGDCDCDGNVLDALGVCGGTCAEDLDNDGICDSIDPCIDLYGNGCEFQGCMDPDNPAYNPIATYEEEGDCLVGGCNLPDACNYDVDAEYLLPGACEFSTCAGCMDETACNYDVDAEYLLPGACEFSTCAGCMDETACNYDESATLPNNITCTYPEMYYDEDCDGDCLNDINANGICDEEEDSGCLISFACNWDPDATIDDGSCEFTSCVGCTDIEACNYDATATVHDPSACEFAELGYDCDGSCQCSCLCDYGYEDGDGICDVLCIPGCTDPEALNYNPIAEDNDGSCTYPVPGCMDSSACNYNVNADFDDGSCALNDECGVCGGSGIAEGECDCDGNVLDALGVCGGTCAEDLDNDGICDSIDPCIDLYGNGCEFQGCMDPDNPGYHPIATYEEEGDCLVGGCTISIACNYNPDAEYQLLGTCDFSTCSGCMDAAACNYDASATFPNNSTCTYPLIHYDCNGNCIEESVYFYVDNGDPICVQYVETGCMDADNPGFNPSATVPDPEACLVAGCLIPFACNYDEDADYIDVSLCEFTSCLGCTDVTACNYDPAATLSSAAMCTFPSTPLHCCDCGICLCDIDGDGVCCEQEIPGCTDLLALNYNPFATDDDGTCSILVGGCVIPFACNYDPDADYYLAGSCDFSCL